MPRDHTPITYGDLIEVLISCQGLFPNELEPEDFRDELSRRLEADAPKLAARVRQSSGHALAALGWFIDAAHAVANPNREPEAFRVDQLTGTIDSALSSHA